MLGGRERETSFEIRFNRSIEIIPISFQYSSGFAGSSRLEKLGFSILISFGNWFLEQRSFWQAVFFGKMVTRTHSSLLVKLASHGAGFSRRDLFEKINIDG